MPSPCRCNSKIITISLNPTTCAPLETTEDTAEAKAEAAAQGNEARSRAAEKRDKEASASGQGQFDFDKAEPAAGAAGSVGPQPAAQDGSPAPAPAEGPDQVAPVVNAANSQEATEGTEVAVEEAHQQSVSDQSVGQADTTSAPALEKSMPLSGDSDLIKKAALLRRKNQKQQAALPLPEVNYSTAEVSLESAAFVHLRIDKLTTVISETLSAAP